MDFPYYEFPGIGNRWLIAVVAVFHVVINHSAAIGGSLVVVLAERHALKTGDEGWAKLAYRLTFAFFLLTTTVGALSGVGIWFTVMVSQPAGLAALLRIFFWAWFVEWAVFVAEIVMVLAYFLSWKSFANRERHLMLGWAYVATSFATMAIVTGILGAMLTPGRWLEDGGFWGAFFNPTYLPQLTLRLGIALAMAASLAMALARFFAEPGVRGEFDKLMSKILLASAPLIAIGGVTWLWVLPDHIRGLIPTAVATTRFASWAQHVMEWQAVAVVALAALGFWGVRRTQAWPTSLAIALFIALTGTLGAYERVREFVRKPYIIPGYMYANGILVADVPQLNQDGVLKHAKWLTPGDQPGRSIFKLECASCHTLEGPNGLGPKVAGKSAAVLEAFIGVQHQVHPFMPPFVGTPEEKKALAAYLQSLRP